MRVYLQTFHAFDNKTLVSNKFNFVSKSRSGPLFRYQKVALDFENEVNS